MSAGGHQPREALVDDMTRRTAQHLAKQIVRRPLLLVNADMRAQRFNLKCDPLVRMSHSSQETPNTRVIAAWGRP
jgi:hypothetical protein